MFVAQGKEDVSLKRKVHSLIIHECFEAPILCQAWFRDLGTDQQAKSTRPLPQLLTFHWRETRQSTAQAGDVLGRKEGRGGEGGKGLLYKRPGKSCDIKAET